MRRCWKGHCGEPARSRQAAHRALCAALFVLTTAPAPPPVFAATCPQTDLGSAIPVTTTGSTVGEGNQVGEPSCVFTYDTPDATFLWTAPATATYQLDTQGSDFDTVLSVRDATCTGTELACNDDDPVLFPQSRLFVSLAAGQQVVIVVTGVGDQGAYVLHMALAPPPCLGDCDHNGVVTVDELLEMVNIALGNLPASACLPGNANGDDQVTVDEILAAVSNALSGCPAG